jgi:hypothetical protein
MRTVIELAPELKSAWENLAIALRAAGKAEELKDVDNRYAQRFGEPMRGP